MTKNFEEFLNEARTNPTQIAKFVKTWIMEAIPQSSYQTGKNQLRQIFDSIKTGIKQGIHEYEKSAPDDLDVLNIITYIDEELDKIYLP